MSGREKELTVLLIAMLYYLSNYIGIYPEENIACFCNERLNQILSYVSFNKDFAEYSQRCNY